MRRYWTRIALGALLVFGLGLAGLAAVRKGTAEVRSFLATTATKLPLRFANIGFRLGGRRIGELTELKVVKRDAGDLGRLTGLVEITEPEAIEELADCSLTLERTGHLDENSSFFCAEDHDLTSGSLIEVGEFEFRPGKLRRPLYLPQDAITEWRRSEIQSLDARIARDGKGGVQASGMFGIQSRERGSQRGSFDLHADSQGAILSVRDALNRSLLDFKATRAGLHLNIRDRHGRGLLRFLADSLGAALSVKP